MAAEIKLQRERDAAQALNDYWSPFLPRQNVCEQHGWWEPRGQDKRSLDLATLGSPSPIRNIPDCGAEISKLLDCEGLQFLDVDMAVFCERHHHRCNAFAALDAGTMPAIRRLRYSRFVHTAKYARPRLVPHIFAGGPLR